MKKSTNKGLKNYYVINSKQRLIKFGDLFAESLYTLHRQSLEKAVKELYDYIIEVLDTQRYKWKPLKPKYKESKLKKGLSGKILIATGEYYNAIEYKITPTEIYVGLPNAVHQESGLPYNILARIHEFGSVTRNIPPRPLWRPALSWWVRKWNSEHKRNLIKNVKKDMEHKIRKL